MANNTDKKSIDNYLKEAQTWEINRISEIEKSRKTAWRVATVAGATTLVMAVALSLLTPLKKTEPFVIRVDNSTGIVDVVESLNDGKVNYDEAVNKFFTQWYVRYREGYSMELSEDYYSYVGMLSAPAEQKKYFDYFQPKNPLSPLNVFGKTAKVKLRIKSTSFIKENVALVRYVKDVYRDGADKPESTHWAATITFKYSGAPMKESERAINPLGFQVSEYRNDPDAVTTEYNTTAQAAAVTTATPSVTVFAGQTSQTPAPAPVVPAVQP